MTFETSNSKIKALLVLLGSLALTVGCLWIALNPDAAADTEGYSRNARRARAMGGMLPYFMWACTLLFGASTVLGLLRLFDSKPKIRINENGVYVAKLSKTTIPWSDIHGLNRKDIKIQKSNQNLARFIIIASSDVVFKRISKTKTTTNPGFKTVQFIMNGFKDSPDQIWNALVNAAKTYKA